MVKNRLQLAELCSVLLIVVAGGSLLHTAFGDSICATMTMQPSATTYNVGDNVTVKLYENSTSCSSSVVGVSAIVTFPASKLTYASVDGNGAFNSAEPPPTVGNGTVEIDRTNTSGLTGNQLVETVHFTATATGSAALAYDPSSQVNSSSDGSNVAGSKTGTYLTLQTAPAAPTPPTGGGGGGTAPAAPASPPSGTNKSTSVSVGTTPSNAVAVPNGGSAQVSQAVDVQPSTVQTQGVKKVEYYLDGKLVSTKTTAPYTYHVDTSKLVNGKHDLITKTYYTNGSTKSSTQHLVVVDGIKARSQTNSLAIVVPLLIIAAAFGFIIFSRGHLRRRWPNTPAEAPTVAAAPPPTVPTTITVTQAPEPQIPTNNDPANHPVDHVQPDLPQPATVVSPDSKPPVNPPSSPTT